ncbi:MAG: ROK family transcriptional regulator [Candidatus Nanopelagicales bacterium]|nr:ROK family transcriptional regulator [Candidatus Nanopelagicales bacterium]
MTAASQDEVRRNNLALVLRHLHFDGPVSRSELVAYTGLNRSTVGDLVTELADEGLVVEQPGASGSVGRPSLVVAPRAESAVTLAFDFRVERVVGAIVGIGGEIIARVDAPNTRTDVDPQAAIEQLLDMSHELLDAVPDDALWVGTGVGVPGIVDASNGMVKQAPNLNWIDVPLGEMLARGFREVFGDVPATFIGNDADLGAWAEHIRGAGAAVRNVIYISGEVGVGGGVVLNGQLMSGAGGFGGEIGHMVVQPDGLPCRCGSRGCWETVIGRNAVIHCLPGNTDATDIAQVIDALHAGNPRVRAGMHEVGNWLGIGLGNLVNIFNPDVIVLGGHLSALLPELKDEIDAMVGRSIRAAREQVHIVVPALGRDSTLVGAAESAFAPLLERPIEALRQSSTLVAL